MLFNLIDFILYFEEIQIKLSLFNNSNKNKQYYSTE